MKSKSLRKQLVISLIISLFILCVLSNTVVYSYIKNLELQAFDGALARKVESLVAATVTDARGQAWLELNEVELREFMSSPDEAYFALRSSDKRVLLRSPSLGRENLPILSRQPNHLDIRNILLPDGRHGRAASFLFLPDRPGADPGLDGVYLTVALSRERLDHINRIELSFALLVGLLLVLGAVGIVWITVGRSFQKFRRFSDQVNTIDYNNLSERLAANGLPAEMIPFKEQFNQLMTRLEAGSSREKRYNANVSHELRTPIAELRLLSEVALMETDDNGRGAEFREYFQDARDLALKMEHLVDTIAALNRCDSGKQKIHVSEFQLAESVRDGWTDWADKARARRIAVRFDLVEPSPLVSDKNLLEAVLANLFSNAVTYAQSGGHFHSQLTRRSGQYEMQMTNTVEGLAGEDLEHFTEPFWQKEDSRTNPSHVGLGWSLIAAYCKTLNVQWVVDLPQRDLFRVRLYIPGRLEPVEGREEWEEQYAN